MWEIRADSVGNGSIDAESTQFRWVRAGMRGLRTCRNLSADSRQARRGFARTQSIVGCCKIGATAIAATGVYSSSTEVERLARRGLRVLAIAERSASNRSEVGDVRVSAMELLGFVGLADSVRPTAAAAVADLRAAGIDVAMITGDNPSAARAIGMERGIVNGTE